MSTFGTSSELTGAQAPVEAGQITACRKCGSRFFSVKESSVYRTELGSDGQLRFIDYADCEVDGFDLHMIDQADCEIDSIACWDCFETYSEDDFAEVLP